MARPVAPWRIGVDVGGTFTDLVLVDADASTWVAKVPSVPSDPSQGVLAAVERVAVDLGLPTRDVLADCGLFVHGSTVATNTMLEGKGATVGLVTTEGFRDVIEIRRGLRPDQWNHREPYAPVLVPRYLRLPMAGRIDADGSEHQPLDLGCIDDVLTTFRDEGVESIAVAFMNSYANPAHEHAAADALGQAWDGDWISTSADVSPLMGEYERTSTAVVNATLMPLVVGYLHRLETELSERGLVRSLLLVQSNGGAASVSQLASRPVNLLLSGPAAAVGALTLYSHLVDDLGVAAGDEGNLISMEIGGTSCDVLLMAGREVDTKDDIDVAGYHVSTPAIDIHTIGAGGGTIAGVDDAGMLFVGPEGAGADPGPACYGHGGVLPTVTDAHLVLGRLRAGKSPGGTLDLDLDAAIEAIRIYVAEPLVMSVHDAAAGIIELTEQHLLSAVEHISIERGHSPRRFSLVAAGGAGPMHGAAIGAGLGCHQVYVPRDAGALCAIGMLHADIRQDFTKVLVGSLDASPKHDASRGLRRSRCPAATRTRAPSPGADVEHPGAARQRRV
jgi:N-methylhydantoinase A